MEGKWTLAAGLFSLVLAFAAVGVFFPSQAGPPREKSPETVSRSWRRGLFPGDETLRVLMADGSVEELALEDYVARVLCAEMPASFAPAALEAQAVCARTYALRRRSQGLHSPQADVCADPACCQGCAQTPPESWGADSGRYEAKLRAAVQATAGEVLTQDGALIDAVFHASSAGFTAPAQAVWGTQVPYLVSVSTPETVETVAGLQEERSFTVQELESLLGPGELGEATYADWGGVTSLAVGDTLFSGQEVRRRLGLRSARFSVEKRDDTVVFTTLGYGHGVGLSQEGANLLAKDGASYRDILAHYYPGATLERY